MKAPSSDELYCTAATIVGTSCFAELNEAMYKVSQLPVKPSFMFSLSSSLIESNWLAKNSTSDFWKETNFRRSNARHESWYWRPFGPFKWTTQNWNESSLFRCHSLGGGHPQSARVSDRFADVLTTGYTTRRAATLNSNVLEKIMLENQIKGNDVAYVFTRNLFGWNVGFSSKGDEACARNSSSAVDIGLLLGNRIFSLASIVIMDWAIDDNDSGSTIVSQNQRRTPGVADTPVDTLLSVHCQGGFCFTGESAKSTKGLLVFDALSDRLLGGVEKTESAAVASATILSVCNRSVVAIVGGLVFFVSIGTNNQNRKQRFTETKDPLIKVHSRGKTNSLKRSKIQQIGN